MFAVIFAYLDAGSGSMLLQVLLGGFAGIAAFAKYRWDRLRGKNPAVVDAEADRES